MARVCRAYAEALRRIGVIKFSMGLMEDTRKVTSGVLDESQYTPKDSIFLAKCYQMDSHKRASSVANPLCDSCKAYMIVWAEPAKQAAQRNAG